jgi:hypothetical protein
MIRTRWPTTRSLELRDSTPRYVLRRTKIRSPASPGLLKLHLQCAFNALMAGWSMDGLDLQSADNVCFTDSVGRGRVCVILLFEILFTEHNASSEYLPSPSMSSTIQATQQVKRLASASASLTRYKRIRGEV